MFEFSIVPRAHASHSVTENGTRHAEFRGKRAGKRNNLAGTSVFSKEMYSAIIFTMVCDTLDTEKVTMTHRLICSRCP